MRAGWEVRTIEEVADHCLGKMLDKNKNRGTPKPYLRNLNVRWFSFDLGDVLEMKFEDSEADRYSLRRGDVAVCEGGYPGRAAIWEGDEPILIQKAIHRVRFHEPERAPWFIYYLWYCNAAGTLKDYFSGSGIQHFTGQALAKFRLPIPPLDEQQRIIAILDEAFAGLDRARANAEVNFQNARELFYSVRDEALRTRDVGSRTVRISDVAEITAKLVDPRKDAYADLLHVGAGNMVTGSDQLIEVKTAREEQLISGKHPFDETMVLYSKIRPYLRKVARPDFRGLCSADVYPLTPKSDVLLRDYLYHLLSGDDFTKYAIAGSDRAGMPKVNRDHLFAYEFSLPPFGDQYAICRKLDELQITSERLAEIYTVKLQELADLRQSLLQKAFAGELT